MSGLSSSLSAVARSCKVSKEDLSSILSTEIRARYVVLCTSVTDLCCMYALNVLAGLFIHCTLYLLDLTLSYCAAGSLKCLSCNHSVRRFTICVAAQLVALGKAYSHWRRDLQSTGKRFGIVILKLHIIC